MCGTEGGTPDWLVGILDAWSGGGLLKEHLGRLTMTERWHTPSDIGRILYCTNAEREAWALWQILPCDMTDEELAAFRTDKRRKQLEKRRRDKGIKSRAEYLAEIATPKPWEAEGIHRRTWERRNAARSDSSPAQGLSPIIVFKEATHPAASVQTESQKKGRQGRGSDRKARRDSGLRASG